ncbi:hypothetical protein ABB37_07242 [Leptomonas pyrrhocoris]|uniref:Uncharacterized protein n=1 Tax=Leptomonas pyrrhocoris TaxID=157538 RepID=A0A0M9FWH0_LEPPY|nr:hypothetical protein ABB37_07242 [Leptomonas pyrrhocoris]XP_015655817.1 hypothetical protein ABB37_07242 [Leptomonas pyrrhocoris]KPA77377.1 hypothetical protein ABB37_07242 [Leptomonas pyrrhocoris]KPA77378.1 hypothetical protein ABB37_07242 [Leptomonas pyrrhocoris]|eukprot:XP_015655816.1 hypothetical protein ABB37_07242 [Leptomonas pyrrhocoris]
MEGAEWDEGEEDAARFLREEYPRVAALPVNIRYRAFAPAAQDAAVRAGRSTHDFYLYRRRRLDTTIEAEVAACGVAVVLPLQSMLGDSFAIAQRQQATYQWLAQRHAAEEILHRFAVDRRLNAAPCLAAVNRALSVLGREGGADAVLDVLEDVLLDSAVIPLSTLLEAIKALPGQPVRAARVALAFKDSLGHRCVPASVWGNLAAALGQAALQQSHPLEEHFMDLYERILAMVRVSTGHLSEAMIVSFGRCLLASHKPYSVALRLVREELLSGRSRDALSTSPLHLGAFLSDILMALCTQEERGAGGRARRGHSDAETLLFATDVMKYAHATRLQLAPKVFDAVLVVCERCRDYARMVALYVSMCLLSTPTLRSTLRVMEVVVQVPETRAWLQRVLQLNGTSFFLWCVQRFPGLYQTPLEAEVQRRATQQLFALLGVLAVEEAQAARLPGVCLFVTREEEMPPLLAAATISSAVCHYRDVHAAAPRSVLHALRDQHADLVRAALHLSPLAAPVGASQLSISVEAELHRLLTSESVYCTVLSAAALTALSARDSAEQAFARMMETYQRKSGAVALVPFECVCPTFGITETATAMLRRWHRDYDWFAVLPLAVSLQLGGTTACDVCCAAFIAARKMHSKVMFIGGTEAEVTAAKARSVEPAVVMEVLVRRLSG